MEKKEYIGKTFDFIAMPTLTIGGMGTTFMFRDNWKEGSWTYGALEGSTNFWMKDLKDDFQNAENLCKGLEYVDSMEDCHYKKKVMDIISSMTGQTGGADLCSKLGFLCELGCWEREDLRHSHLYNREFYKYVRNCLEQYPI